MLSGYMDKQELAYSLFMNDIKNNCVTHAYLIDENNFSQAYDMVLSFVKAILCDNIEDETSSLCKRIDEGNYPELKIISPDGQYIKKQQIIDLQQEFSRTAVEGKKRIYIIRDCEKMKTETANSMLKFLEEPEDGIIAILMTNNLNNVLSTIISRCKIVKLNCDVEKVADSSEDLNELAIDFVDGIEKNYFNTFLKIKDIWFSKVNAKERSKMIIILDIILDIYYDIMKIIIGNKDIKYIKWVDKIEELSRLNKLDDIIKKIDIILEAKDSIKFNVNSNLLVDSIIVSIGGVNDGSRY